MSQKREGRIVDARSTGYQPVVFTPSGYHSIRMNDQWRVVFRWLDGAHEVQVVDYH